MLFIVLEISNGVSINCVFKILCLTTGMLCNRTIVV